MAHSKRMRSPGREHRLYDPALIALTELEINAMAHIAKTANLDLSRLPYMLWDSHVVDTLRAAFPYTKKSDRTSKLVYPYPMPNLPVSLYINFPQLEMLAPEPEAYATEEFLPVGLVIQQLAEQHKKFELVRYVITWLNHTATRPAAARYYCPWLVGLLPADHPCHTAGSRFKNPPQFPHDVVSAIRQSAGIVATAMLFPRFSVSPPGDVIAGVMFGGERVVWDNSSQVRYTTPTFPLQWG